MKPTENLLPIDPKVISGIVENPESFITALVNNGVLRRVYYSCPATHKIIAEVEFIQKCQGPPGCVHGGLLAALLDELMAVAVLQDQKIAMTGRLKVDFLKPCRFPDAYRAEAWIQEADSISALVHARMLRADDVLVTATGRFVRVN